MIVSIIVAMDSRGAIGVRGGLPWRLSSDLKRFRERTLGHHIIMGRKTFESIGKPLPGRETIIITRDQNFKAEGCAIARSLDEALSLARARGEQEAFICGGAQIYEQAIALADRVYLTAVHTQVEADTFFPAWDRSEWIEKESIDHPMDEKNQYAFSFKLLERR
ncbi:MAG: dihydrofolate reductase [Acidobacteriota bacterium]